MIGWPRGCGAGAEGHRANRTTRFFCVMLWCGGHATCGWTIRGYFSPAYLPTARGFDSHLGYYEAAMDYWNHST